MVTPVATSREQGPTMNSTALPEIPVTLRVAQSPGELAGKLKTLTGLCTEVAELFRREGRPATPLSVGGAHTEEACWMIWSTSIFGRTVACYLTTDGNLVMKGDKCPHVRQPRPPHYLQIGQLREYQIDLLIACLKAIGGESSGTSS